MGKKYRADIDGLRATAVIPVLLFHFGIPYLPGGFVGVDVFFVISGFLITGIIHRDILDGSFSIIQFYERRIRRILPALAAVVLATTIVAYFMFMPQTFKDFGQSLAALGVFSSNLMFYLESGYFDSGSWSKPLLHTWSLSVEEQYYIAMPLILVLVSRFSRSRLILILVVLAAISFYCNLRASTGQSSFAFYMPITRAWELLAGGLVALHLVKHKPSIWVCTFASLIGVLMLLFSYLYISEEMPFPGIVVMIPVLATALLIYGGSDGNNIVNYLFTAKPFVYIGNISYSLYLVHWPLVVFWIYYSDEELAFYESVVLFVTSFVLAHLCWKYIETPFRDRSWIARRLAFSYAIALMLSFLLVGIYIATENGIPSRLETNVRLASEFQENPNRSLCHQKSAIQIKDGDYCVLGNDSKPSFALIGDSHADALSTSIVDAVVNSGESIAIFTRGGCRPFNTGFELERQCGIFDGNELENASCNERSMQQCNRFNVAAFEEAANLDVDTIVLSARWASQYFGTGSKRYDYCYSSKNYPECSQKNNKSVFKDEFNRTLVSLRNIEKVVVLGPTPEYRDSIPELAGKAALFSRPLENLDWEFAFRGKEPLEDMATIAEKFTNTEVVDFYPLFCSDSSCSFLKDGKSLYADAHHISVYGNEFLRPIILDAITRVSK